jgi:hypothetical protein
MNLAATPSAALAGHFPTNVPCTQLPAATARR